MKLISLNIWGGRAGKEKLLSFFEKYKNIDIFCLQEVWRAPYEHLEGHLAGGLEINHSGIMVHGMQEISALLCDHVPYFRPHLLDNYGLMMLVNKGLSVVKEGDIFVHKHRGYIPDGDAGKHARNIQYATFRTPRGNRTVMNFHGLWNGQGKGDSEDRLIQSDNIIDFMKTVQDPHLICGDFNLLPETESLRKLEYFGLRNLIKEHSITSTRTSFYTKPEKFADYVFTRDDIKVNDFGILPDEVSDHSPIYLDFE